GDVVKAVFLIRIHTLQTVLNNDSQFIGVSGIIGAAIRNGIGQNMAVPILVLQTFTIQGGTTGSSTDQEAARLYIAGKPVQISNSLEAEHGVINVERHQGDFVGAISRGAV